MARKPQKTKKEPIKFLKGKFYGLYNNSAEDPTFAIDNKEALFEATYIAGRAGSYDKRIDELEAYIGQVGKLSENDRKYVINLENILNKGIEQRAIETKTKFYGTAKKGVGFQRKIAGDSELLQKLIYEPKFEGTYVKPEARQNAQNIATAPAAAPALPIGKNKIKESEKPISDRDLSLAFRHYNFEQEQADKKETKRKHRSITSLLVAGALLLGGLVGYNLHDCKGENLTNKNKNTNQIQSAQTAQPFQLLSSNYTNSTTNDISVPLVSTNNSSNSVSLIDDLPKPIMSLDVNSTNNSSSSNNLKNVTTKKSRYVYGGSFQKKGGEAMMEMLHKDALQMQKDATNHVSNVSTSNNMTNGWIYAQYSLDQGSRSSIESFRKAGNSGREVFRDLSSLINDKFANVRSNDFKINIAAHEFGISTKEIGKNFIGLSDHGKFSGGNGVTKTVTYLGGLVTGPVEFTLKGLNVFPFFGLLDNITTPAFATVHDSLETIKHTEQGIVNPIRSVSKNHTFQKVMDGNNVLTEYLSNVGSGEGFSNTKNPQQSIKDKGKLGYTLEFLGDALLLEEGIRNSTSGNDSPRNDVHGGTSGEPGVGNSGVGGGTSGIGGVQ